MRKAVLATLAVLATALSGALLAPESASAIPEPAGPSHSPLGLDVSWPQCGRELPRGAAFAVVGVTGGLANDTNPCLAEQLAWAGRSSGRTAAPPVSLYVNTANPGHEAEWWPSSNATQAGRSVANPYGACFGEENAACAYVYGYSMARDDVLIRGVDRPSDYLWWLDVETENTWSLDRGANAAALEGMVAGLRSAGGQVGLYSTSFQWFLIVGTPRFTSSLNGLPSWLAGASSASDAYARCDGASLTPGGRVALVQFVSKDLDYNVSCD